jgi:hypothetical protein
VKTPWKRKPPIRITLAMYRVMRGKTRERTKVEPNREPGTVHRLRAEIKLPTVK